MAAESSSPAPDRRELLKNAFEAIEQLKAKVRSLESAASEPIAIIGAGCRFPGGTNDLDSYWSLLQQGREVVTEIPASRWERMGYKDIPSGWRAGLVEGLDTFDARFFGVSAREATTMDPQQRMVLEVAWEALENAGQAPDHLTGSRTGVFLGITGHDYGDLLRDSGGTLDVYAATGNANNAAAGRLSFTLGLQGPSVAVDTACSSSLVAIHMASLALKAGDCTMAIAGGVNALLAPWPFVCFGNWGMMSSDGRCKTFDAHADGFVRSEGCGLIILKRLSQAQADGDRILALIRGSSVNQDGRSSGLTVPNGPAQENVVRQALASGKVDPLDVSYIEAHGTGTSLGDPIEAHALAAVLGPHRQPDNPLVVGSVKTNMGHLESAAGVAGLLKVVVSLQHEQIPPHLHFTAMNPDIDWNDTPVEIPVNGKAWPRGARKRIAGVSSFGFSGTNAHIVLEEAPPQQHEPQSNDRPLHLFTLSARTEAARDALTANVADALQNTDAALGDICYTANTGRAQFSERVAITAANVDELRQKISAKSWTAGKAKTSGNRIAFLFTGQGSQWAGMGRELYETEPVFRDALNDCAAKLSLDQPLLDVLYGPNGALLDETAYTQPALFALEWSLAQLWQNWGIHPDVVLGHSVGECVALCVAGAWTLDDGLRLIAERGRLMQALGTGWGMTSVTSTRQPVETALQGLEQWVSIAAVNAPESIVISGRMEELHAAERRLQTAGAQVKPLTVSHAFHSPQMQGVATEFAKLVQRVPLQEPRVRIVSSVTGQLVDTSTLRDSGYWQRQVRNAVEFQAAMETLASAGYETFLEVGPSPTLSSLGRQCIGREGQLWAPSLKKDRGAVQQTLDTLGQLYVRGATVDWKGFDAAHTRHRVPLPTYPFQRQRHWLEEAPRPKRPKTGHPLLGTRVAVAGPHETYLWENEVTLDAFPYLADHRVQGNAIMPATAYLEMTFAVGYEMLGDGPMAVSNLRFYKPLFLAPTSFAHLQVSYDAVDGTVHIYTRPGTSGPWTLHASGHVARAEETTPQTPPADIEARARQQMTNADFYTLFHARGNDWGPMFQGVEHAWLGDQEGWSHVVVPEPLRAEMSRYHFHPAVSDAAGHILAAITDLATPEGSEIGAFVGEGIERVVIYNKPRGTRLLACARVTPTSDPTLRHGDVRVFDEDGRFVSDLRGARLHYLEFAQKEIPTTADDNWFYQLAWREIPFADEAPEPAASQAEWIIIAGTERETALAQAVAGRMQTNGVRSTILSQPSSNELSDTLASHPSANVVRLCGAPTAETAAATKQQLENIPAAVTNTTSSLIAMIHAMADQSPSRVWIVTCGAQPTNGAPDTQGITQAPLWGIGRTISVEHPELYGGLVDLDPTASVQDAADTLWRHLRAPTGEDQVSLTGSRRFAARLERYHAPSQGPLPLRPDGTYLITGGLGGLGLEVARWLVASGARRLMLMGRKAIPPRSQWKTLAPDHPQAQAVAAIRELEAAGATVYAVAADTSDANALHTIFDSYTQEGWPPIRGVVHAAGVMQHHTLLELTPTTLDEALRPKLGAWSLQQALIDAPLDFFVLFSSASALLSSPKLGAYAAGNCFLDAFAHYRHAHGQPALSINWGVWGEAGMASRFSTDSLEALAERGMGAMRTAQGLDALGRLMNDARPEAAVLPVNWQRWGELYPAYTASPLLSDLFQHSDEGNGSVSSIAQPNAVLNASPDERPEQLRQYLTETIGAILGFSITEIDPSTPISALGLDSLTAVEFKNRITSTLGVSLPMVRFLQGPPIDELVAEINPLLAAVTSVAIAPSLSADTDSAGTYPLAHGQKALWFLQKLQPAMYAYNVAFAARLRPKLNLELFQKAIDQIAARHASLRTTFPEQNGEPVQQVLPHTTLPVRVVEMDNQSDAEVQAAVWADYQRPFKLDERLASVSVYRRADEDILLINVHHLIFDAKSLQILFEDLRAIYEAELAGNTPVLPPLPAQYRDFVAWQGQMLAGPQGEALWNYWSNILTNAPPPLEIATTRPPTYPLRGASIPFAIEPQLAAELPALAKSQQTTLYTVLLAAMQLFLYKFSGQPDLTIGTPVSLRTRSEWSHVIGYFINMLPIRSTIDIEESFVTYLSRTREAVLGALDHQDFPFSLMVDRLKIRREPNRSPVFQAMLNVLVSPSQTSDLSRLFRADAQGSVRFGTSELTPYVIPQQEGQFEIVIEVTDSDGTLHGNLKYQTDLYTPETAQHMTNSYHAILEAIVKQPHARIAELLGIDRDDFQL